MTKFLCGVFCLISSRFLFLQLLLSQMDCTPQTILKISKKCFVHSPCDSEWVHGEAQWVASLMRISEEVCWLQQEQNLSANNSDDRSAADLCSWKTILMIQLRVAELNGMTLLTHIFVYCAVVASLNTQNYHRQVKSNYLSTTSFSALLPCWTEYHVCFTKYETEHKDSQPMAWSKGNKVTGYCLGVSTGFRATGPNYEILWHITAICSFNYLKETQLQ